MRLAQGIICARECSTGGECHYFDIASQELSYTRVQCIHQIQRFGSQIMLRQKISYFSAAELPKSAHQGTNAKYVRNFFNGQNGGKIGKK